MASGRNKVEQGVDTIVSEAGVTPDARLFSENIIVLTLQVADNLLEAITRKRVLMGFR